MARIWRCLVQARGVSDSAGFRGEQLSPGGRAALVSAWLLRGGGGNLRGVTGLRAVLLLALGLGVTFGFTGTQIFGRRGKCQGNPLSIVFLSLNPTSQAGAVAQGLACQQ